MTPWNPWQALWDRPHIVFRFDPIARLAGGAIYARRGTRAAIVLDPILSAPERTAWLAHELVHDERGGGCDWPGMPSQWSAVVAREEAQVERIVATRLVPPAELADFVTAQLAAGEAVTVDIVAERFEVAPSVAEAAIQHHTMR